MGLLNRAIAAGGLGLSCALLAGCGSGGGLLSAGQAARLDDTLASVSRALGDHACQKAASGLAGFEADVQSLSGVSATLISDLDRAASATARLADRECPTSSTRTTTTTTQTTSTQTTPSTPTTTTTTTTTQTTTTPTTPSTPTTTTTQTTTTPTTPSTTTSTTPTTPTTGGTGIGTPTTPKSHAAPGPGGGAASSAGAGS